MARAMRMRRSTQAGFTYLWVLFAVALLGVSLVAVSEVWVSNARQEQREQVTWVGEQYRLAIASYYESAPDGNRSYPKSMAQLLEDRRFGVPRRHLRRAYAPPGGAVNGWQEVRCRDGGVCGVRTDWPGGSEQVEFAYSPSAR